MMTTQVSLVEAKMLDPRPGDFLLARVLTPGLSQEARERIRAELQEAVGPAVKVLTFEGADVELELVRNPLRHPDEVRRR